MPITERLARWCGHKYFITGAARRWAAAYWVAYHVHRLITGNPGEPYNGATDPAEQLAYLEKLFYVELKRRPTVPD